MNIEIVKFNGKDYLVYNPGIILRDGKKVIDQLKDGITVMPKSLNIYIKKNYNLTPEEYYIIVALRGDNSIKGYCQYPGCGKKLDFVKIIQGYRVGCCSSHGHYLQCIRNIDEGTNPIGGELGKKLREKLIREGRFYGSSKENSERMRKLNLEKSKNGTNPFLSKFGLQKSRIENGTHNFQKEENRKNTSDRLKQLAKEGKHAFQSKDLIKKNKNRIKNLTEIGEFHLQKLDNKIKANKNSFINRGNTKDKYHFYIAETESGLLKIGCTDSINGRVRRSNERYFNDDSYVTIDSLFTGSKVEVAEIEYQVKLEFSKFAIKGTEFFNMDMKYKILTKINELLSSTTIETTDDNKSEKE